MYRGGIHEEPDFFQLIIYYTLRTTSLFIHFDLFTTLMG